jgi:hypothetical protein
MIRASSLRLALASITAVALASISCGGSKAPPPAASVDAGSGDPTLGTASIGPLDLAPGDEETVCIFKRLTTTEDIMATDFVADLAPGSHHLIVYKSTAPEENLDPTPCVPFLGLIDQSAIPIMLVGKLHVEFTLPANVGVSLPAGQMLKIEAHYINATSAHLQGQGSVQIRGVPTSQAQGFVEASYGFWGTTHIDIPPMSSFSTPVMYQSGIPGTNIFAVSSHQHQLGTHVQVWQTQPPPGGLHGDAGAAGASGDDAGDEAGTDAGSAAPGDAGSWLPPDAPLVLDETDWSQPQIKSFAPPLTFDGSNGFAYQCSWNNTTTQEVKFGESALDEMCFVGLYYYPSQGFDLCLNGRCENRR